MLSRFLPPLLLAAVPSVVVAVGACSSTSGSTPAATAGPVARFAFTDGATPDFMEVPFPSDVYRNQATGHLVEIPSMKNVFKVGSEFLSHELPRMDGFSRIAMSLFFVDDPTAPTNEEGEIGAAAIDPKSLPFDEKACVADGSAVFVIDLAATDPAKARIPCRAAFHHDRSVKVRPLVAVGPARGIVLEEAHAYATVMTSRVKDASGHAVAASAAFKALRDGSAAGVYRQPLDTAKTLLATALATDKAEIVAIAPFTTNAMTKELFTLREQLEDAPAATLKWDATSMAPMGAVKFAAPVGGNLPAGFTASLDGWLGVVDAAAKLPDGTDDPDALLPVRAHDKIAALGTGVFDAINYLQVKGDGYGSLDHATFARDASGKIIPAPEKPTSKIWMTIALPTAPMPADGYPVVIVQHGLSGSREFLVVMANVFCAAGFAVVGIDSVTFGARAPEPLYQVDANSDYEKKPGAKYKGPDGLADADAQGNRNGSTDLFGTLKNIGALRDQFRQAEFDTAQLVKLVRSSTLDLAPLQTGATAPKLDASRIAYFGDSLGAIQGTVAASFEPNVKYWGLNVVGGGLLLELGAHSASIGALLNLAAGANFGFTENSLNESHPLTNIVQLIADPGDPINYASLLVTHPRAIKGTPIPPRNLVQMSVLYDEIVATESNEALARAGGWGFATPNVGSNSGILDLKNLANNPGRVTLMDIMPDANKLFHDTPVMGTTAIAIQVSPAQHGTDITSSLGRHRFGIPYANFDGPEPFPILDFGKDFTVRQPYREIMATFVQFYTEGFAGKVPTVSVRVPPVRDFDDDGATDDVDADPANPHIK